MQSCYSRHYSAVASVSGLFSLPTRCACCWLPNFGQFNLLLLTVLPKVDPNRQHRRTVIVFMGVSR